MFSDDIEKEIKKHFEKQNNTGLEEFDGISPNQMHYLLREPFAKQSIIKLNRLSEQQYQSIPLLNQIKYLVKSIGNETEVKLTKTGALPTKIVKDTYHNGGLTEEFIEEGYTFLRRESDSHTIQLSRILLELIGFTKKRNNKLSLTKKAKKILENDHRLLELVFTAFCQEFNWGYFDGYELDEWGQYGVGFSLMLLHKYGSLKRKDSFYAEKYYKAFPDLLDFHPFTPEIKNSAYRGYAFRTFEKGLSYFGFIDYERGRIFDPSYVIKTRLFDAFISVKA
ncbi:hypothetical protein [uncultured Dokdonia sp.]|uniref:hypothetical protein n=1 Tax=uncultured Dokdonia sp. TaxID=575653 RepID=UPI002609518B|nr:hypothetical protein [uncultured Dokdonia sp.]